MNTFTMNIIMVVFALGLLMIAYEIYRIRRDALNTPLKNFVSDEHLKASADIALAESPTDHPNFTVRSFTLAEQKFIKACQDWYAEVQAPNERAIDYLARLHEMYAPLAGSDTVVVKKYGAK